MSYFGPEGSYHFSEAARADILRVAGSHPIQNGEPALTREGQDPISGEKLIYRLGVSEQVFNLGNGLGETTLPTYFVSEERTQRIDKQLLDTESGAGVVTSEQIATSGLLLASIEWRYDAPYGTTTRDVRLSHIMKIKRVDLGETTDTVMSIAMWPQQDKLTTPAVGSFPWAQWRKWIAYSWERRKANREAAQEQNDLSRTQEQHDLRHLIPAIQAFGGKTRHLEKRLVRDDKPQKRYYKDKYGSFVRPTQT